MMDSFGKHYRGRSVLVTGHTGFKGSWLSLWLSLLGARVSGFALPPPEGPSHWALLKLGMPEDFVDVRDYEAVRRQFTLRQPEIVFHLAAQPLVLKSYAEPLATWNTNVMGTANVLEAARFAPSVKAVVVVTTDKCYENLEREEGYREDDRLGGHDPYSSSKAAAEILCASYRLSFFGKPSAPLLATARGGNVIGGGDWAESRLIPDAVRSVQASSPMEVRHPESTRPWQHVLECLHGYLLLGARLLEGDASCACAWNFGPSQESRRTVKEVLDAFSGFWPAFSWIHVDQGTPHEAKLLALDSSKARQVLKWNPQLGWLRAVELSASWYSAWLNSGALLSKSQIEAYMRELEKGAPSR